jgi:hypothetical protein
LWISWFRAAGFLSDNGQAPPTGPLKVYRGVVRAAAGGHWIRRMSWSQDLATAQWFANRFYTKGSVYEAWVPPAGVLAIP